MGFNILVYGALTADGAVFLPAALEGSKNPRNFLSSGAGFKQSTVVLGIVVCILRRW